MKEGGFCYQYIWEKVGKIKLQWVLTWGLLREILYYIVESYCFISEHNSENKIHFNFLGLRELIANMVTSNLKSQSVLSLKRTIFVSKKFAYFEFLYSFHIHSYCGLNGIEYNLNGKFCVVHAILDVISL